jgi:hypothetical protein
MHRVKLRIFVALAFALAVGLALGLSPYASGSPDGLERVAGDKGFIDDGRLHSLQERSPIPDYAFPGIDDPRLATAIAGFIGTIGVFLAAWGAAWLLARRRSGREGDATMSARAA